MFEFIETIFSVIIKLLTVIGLGLFTIIVFVLANEDRFEDDASNSKKDKEE